MADNVAKAVGAAGLPSSSVPEFVADLLGQNTTGLAEVPGVMPDIVNAGVGALLDTYTKGFRNVWASAAAFVTLATIGMFYDKPVMICTNELTNFKRPSSFSIPAKNLPTTSMPLSRRMRICIRLD